MIPTGFQKLRSPENCNSWKLILIVKKVQVEKKRILVIFDHRKSFWKVLSKWDWRIVFSNIYYLLGLFLESIINIFYYSLPSHPFPSFLPSPSKPAWQTHSNPPLVLEQVAPSIQGSSAHSSMSSSQVEPLQPSEQVQTGTPSSTAQSPLTQLILRQRFVT